MCGVSVWVWVYDRGGCTSRCGCVGVGVGVDVGVNEALEHPGMLGLERFRSGADGGMKCKLMGGQVGLMGESGWC